MDRSALVGILGQLGCQLLDTVFSAAVHTGGNGLADGFGIIHFGGGAQPDPAGIPSGSQGGGLDILANARNIFGNGHEGFLLSIKIRATGSLRRPWPVMR